MIVGDIYLRAYIINLKRSPQRLEHIVSQVEQLGLDYEVVEAIDGLSLLDVDLENLCDMATVERHPAWLNAGAIGAALSHRLVYNRIIESCDDHALVLEDDSVLPEGLLKVIDGIEKAVSKNEVALLYYSCFKPLQLSTRNSRELTSEHSLMFPMFLDGVGGAVCYVITRDAAISIYKGTQKIWTAADSWLDYFKEGLVENVRCVYPMVADHLGVKSTISSATQGRWRRRITEFIDKCEVPVFYRLLVGLRRRSLQARMNFSLTDVKSPIDRHYEPEAECSVNR